MTDYVAKLGVTLQPEDTGTRVRFQHQSVLFGKLAPDTLRERLNEAMQLAVAHYTRTVERRQVELEARHIEGASLQVVLHHLFVYNSWRLTTERHKEHPLRLEQEDLTHPQSHDECWFYCEKVLGADYARHAAALTGMSLEEFARYQAGRRAFWDR